MAETSQFTLLRQRRFAPFFWTQFLGAFNDNIYKNALVIMLAFQVSGLTASQSNLLINLSAGLFILPFFLFSATSGQLADKYERSRLIRHTVLLKAALMLLAALGFYLNSLPVLMLTLFLDGVQSTLFGPVKYAILPQHLKTEELIGGNGLVEMGTFVAILLGTVLGGLLISHEQWGRALVSAATIAVAMTACIASRWIPFSPAPVPDLRINWNPWTETIDNLSFTRRNRTVFLAVLGVSWFWFYGATFLAQFPSYGKEILSGDESVVTLLLALFSLGIGSGSLLCERLSGHRVEVGLVPFGSIGLTVFALDLYLAGTALPPHSLLNWLGFLVLPGAWRVIADLMLIGMFGGFFIVPLYALIQSRSEPTHLSRIVAGNNILNALFMVISAVFAISMVQSGLSVAEVLLVTGIVNVAVAAYIYTVVPEFLLRFIVWLTIHSICRLETHGLEHVPDEGPAVLRCAPIGVLDALVITAACRRPIRFAVEARRYRHPLLNFLLRAGRALAYTADGAQSLHDEIAAALAAGDLVCLSAQSMEVMSGRIPAQQGARHLDLALERLGPARLMDRIVARIRLVVSPAGTG
ncbi:MAG: MFS transporter [Gammaproteobacteria bacterium]